MIYFLLNIVADILKWILAPVCYTWGFFHSLAKGEFKEWHKKLAKTKDAYGNVLIQYPGNLLLIKKDGYKFGQIFDMISKVLGKNKIQKTLLPFGKFWANTLNFFDKNHVENSVYEN